MHRECPCHVVLLQIGQSSLRLKTNDRDTVLWNSTIFSSKVNFLFFFSVSSLLLLIIVLGSVYEKVRNLLVSHFSENFKTFDARNLSI